MSDIVIHPVDFTNSAHAQALIDLLDAYARDPMGTNAPLPEAVRDQLSERMSEFGAMAWIAWLDGVPVGLLTALWNYSTFAARPRINIHDISVVPGHRDQGIGWRLLEAVEAFARDSDCCALTLEVRGDNARGRHLYAKFGFTGPTDWSPAESMAFWKKELR